MKKYFIIIFLIVLLSIVAIDVNKIDNQNIGGQLLLVLQTKTPPIIGIVSNYNVDTGNIEGYIDGGYPSFNEQGDKFIFIRNKGIYEYDLTLKNEKLLFVKEKRNILSPRYVPNSNKISFFFDESHVFAIYDLKTCTLEEFDDIKLFYYEWLKDGESILIGSTYVDPIYKLNTKTKKKELYIEKGIRPVLSRDGNLVAFKRNDKNNTVSVLVVRSIITGQEWIRNDRGSSTYCFSPDGNYLAFEQETSSYFLLPAKELLFWDYKNNKQGRLLKEKYLNTKGKFDWR